MAVAPEQPLDPEQHAQWAAKAIPAPRTWGRGLASVTIPAPGFAIRFTYCYLLWNDAGEVIVVDPGWDTDEGWAALTAALAEHGLELSGVQGIVVTHYHADHIAMAGRLAAASGAWTALSAIEAAYLETLRNFDPVRAQHWLDECGVPAGERTVEEERAHRALLLSRLSFVDRQLRDGDALALPGRDLVVVLTSGHTPGHVVVVDRDNRAVLTGDHVLPRITPHVGLFTAEDERDAIAEYRAALDKLMPYADYTALPAHEYVFAPLGGRLRGLLTLTDERADEIAAAVANDPGATPWQIAQAITWSRGWASLERHHRRQALAETYAHLRALGGC
jgi:glyoxylase-like metal-dependent hydrolase (beta-lactamase superfamily II)